MKWHMNLDWIQLPFNENRMKISIKKQTFNLPRNYLKIYKHQISSLKLDNYFSDFLSEV